jgi:hypothetical protein
MSALTWQVCCLKKCGVIGHVVVHVTFQNVKDLIRLKEK